MSNGRQRARDPAAYYWVENGIARYDQVHARRNPLTTVAESELLLGPIGIGIAGWSMGVRSAFAWLGLIIVAVPTLGIV